MNKFLAVLFSVFGVIGLFSGLAYAANGCASGYGQLAHRVSGPGPVDCWITPHVCQAYGLRSTTYKLDSNFQPIVDAVYEVEVGGASSFPECSLDVSNGPWQ